MTPLLPSLPDAARAWAYVSDRPLADAEQAALVDGLGRFFGGWHTHRVPVHGGAAVLHGRLLVVAGAVVGTDDPAALSGCGIDQHVREVERLGRALGVAWLDGLHVAVRPPDGHTLDALPRAAFKAALAAGTIPAASAVLDATATTLQAFRDGSAFRLVADGPFSVWLPPIVSAP